MQRLCEICVGVHLHNSRRVWGWGFWERACTNFAQFSLKIRIFYCDQAARVKNVSTFVQSGHHWGGDCSLSHSFFPPSKRRRNKLSLWDITEISPHSPKDAGILGSFRNGPFRFSSRCLARSFRTCEKHIRLAQSFRTCKNHRSRTPTPSAKKDPQSQKIARTAPKNFLNNSGGLSGHYPVKQGFWGKSHQKVHPNVRQNLCHTVSLWYLFCPQPTPTPPKRTMCSFLRKSWSTKLRDLVPFPYKLLGQQEGLVSYIYIYIYFFFFFWGVSGGGPNSAAMQYTLSGTKTPRFIKRLRLRFSCVCVLKTLRFKTLRFRGLKRGHREIA